MVLSRLRPRRRELDELPAASDPRGSAKRSQAEGGHVCRSSASCLKVGGKVVNTGGREKRKLLAGLSGVIPEVQPFDGELLPTLSLPRPAEEAHAHVEEAAARGAFTTWPKDSWTLVPAGSQVP